MEDYDYDERCDVCDSRYCMPGNCLSGSPVHAYVPGIGYVHVDQIERLGREMAERFPTGRLLMDVDWPQSMVPTVMHALGRRGWSPVRETIVLREVAA